jgi:peptidoglycan/LPS O-acetylase OafA/YrhL
MQGDRPQTAAIPGTGRARAGHFVPRLEAFRGYGCVMVAMVHAEQSLSGSDRTDWTFRVYDVLFNGRAALTMFFVLSGFVLFLSLERGPQALGASAKQFGIARILRIYPPIIFNILLFYILFIALGATLPGVDVRIFEATSLLRNSLLVDANINGAMWSLQLEVLAIPLIFVGYVVFRRFGPAPLVVLLGIAIAASFSRAWSRLGPLDSLGLLYTFLFGMLVPSLGRKLVSGLSRQQAGWTMLVFLAILMLTREVVGYAKNWSPVIEAGCGFVLIAGIAYRPDLKLFSPFDSNLAHLFGKASYSFYLVHPLTLMVIWRIPTLIAAWLEAGIPAVGIALFLGLGSTLVAFLVAYACYLLVERPSIRMIRALDAAPLGGTASSSGVATT